MSTQKKKIVCPTCGKKDTWQLENPFRPFCSERCKLIDLGSWADEKYRVPTSPPDANEPSDEDNEQSGSKN